VVDQVYQPVADEVSYIEAYKKMRRGVLYMLVAPLLLLIIGSILLVTFSLDVIRFRGPVIPPEVPGRMPGDEKLVENVIALIILVIALLVPVVLYLLGLWGNFIPGVRRLGELNVEFRTASRLVHLGFFWGVLLVIIGVLTAPILIGFPILIIGAILVLIGYIGLIILGFKLHDYERDGLYLAAAITFIIGIVLPVLQIIGLILLYVALGHSIKRREALAQTPPSAPPTPV
jgi:uncharacterized membrane protein